MSDLVEGLRADHALRDLIVAVHEFKKVADWPEPGEPGDVQRFEAWSDAIDKIITAVAEWDDSLSAAKSVAEVVAGAEAMNGGRTEVRTPCPIK